MAKLPEIGHDLAAFCEEQIPRLIGVLTLYAGKRAIAEELAQEALARAVLRWSKLRRTESPEGWVYRVAINLANSRWRRGVAERRANQRFGGSDDRYEEDHATALAVRVALTQLTGRQRQAIVLRYYLDLPVDEVAALMDCPESTVKSLTRRGLARLKLTFDLTERGQDGS